MTRDQLLAELLLERYGQPVRDDRPLPGDTDDELVVWQRRVDLLADEAEDAAREQARQLVARRRGAERERYLGRSA